MGQDCLNNIYSSTFQTSKQSWSGSNFFQLIVFPIDIFISANISNFYFCQHGNIQKGLLTKIGRKWVRRDTLIFFFIHLKILTEMNFFWQKKKCFFEESFLYWRKVLQIGKFLSKSPWKAWEHFNYWNHCAFSICLLSFFLHVHACTCMCTCTHSHTWHIIRKLQKVIIISYSAPGVLCSVFWRYTSW